MRAALILAGGVLGLLLPATAGAAMTIDSLALAGSTAQAGARPDLSASFSLGESGGAETAKTAKLRLPAGFFVNPTAVARCAAEDFASFECPSNSQVGLVTVRAEHEGDPTYLLGTAPVYALVPGAGEAARFGFVAPIVELPVAISAKLRAETDYGPDLTFENLPQLAPLAGADLSLWAAPADSGHDSERFPAGSAGEPAGCPESADASCIAGSTPSNLPVVAMTQNPTSCGGSPQGALEVTTYQHPDDALAATAAMAPITGCDKLGFSPLLGVELTTAETNTPSGLGLGFATPQNFAPGSLAPAATKALAVSLPPGLAIDPDAAAALGTCTDAQFALGVEKPSACPAESLIGTFSLAIAGFEEPLDGAAYFGAPEPIGSHRLFLEAVGSGVDAKLVGPLQTDPETGQVTVALANLPQLPLEELQLAIAPETGLLVTPLTCGDHPVGGSFTTWSAPSTPVVVATSLTLASTGPDEGPCPGPASAVEVSLSPPEIVADGSSVTTATATVADAAEIVVPGEEVVFSSTDPDQLVGETIDNGDGTYTAEITASTTAGTATITAADTSVEPAVLGTATLTQLAPERPSPPLTVTPPPAIPPVASRPSVTITRKPARRTADRTPTFRFSSTPPGSIFRCRVDNKPFRPCSSPATLSKLPFGPHAFSVQATDPAGGRSDPATYRFMVRQRR